MYNVFSYKYVFSGTPDSNQNCDMIKLSINLDKITLNSVLFLSGKMFK